jgi:modification methylase
MVSNMVKIQKITSVNFIFENTEKVTESQTKKSTSKRKPNGTIYHGDCIEIMNKMEAESVKVIVTSPPYNIRNSTGNGLKDGRGGKWKNAALQAGYDNHGDAMEHEDYMKWQQDCLTAMMRVLRPDGAIFYNHKWRVQGGLLQDRHDIVNKFPVRQIIIWQRNGGINFNKGYFLPTYEVIYLIAKPDFKLAPKANAMGDVWKIPQEIKNDHPAPFPVELASRCIESVDLGLVLDPFMGSGSTAVAAENAKRPWIGIDISEKYCEMAKSRIEKLIERTI